MNKKTRLIIVATLIFALVLSMVGCSSDVIDGSSEVAYDAAPSTTVATAPAVEESATASDPAEVVADTAVNQVVDTDEAQLELYGITFPEFDSLVYTDDTSEMGKSMSFGADIDVMNLYQEAYNFEIAVKISAVDFEGNSMSKSKFAANSSYVADYIDFSIDYYGYYDASDIADWTGLNSFSAFRGDTENYYFTVGRAGIYTVEYTVEVEFEDAEYGYYTPEEVEEKYTVTKTYTVEKAELEIKTKSDAFEVESDIFFVDSSISLSDEEKAALDDEDLSYSVDVTSCDGTEVGEYEISITITDKDDEIVDPDSIVLSNYYVTVSEGTRYILSAEDVAKANVIRKMAYDDLNSEIPLTTEYSIETITYYNNLTDGQKLLAAVKTDNVEWARISEYLVEYIPVSEDDIEEAEYNIDRADLIDEIEDLIDDYMTASTQRVKDDYLTELSQTILLIDNEAHEYGSDLLYALGELATGVYVPERATEVASVYYTFDEVVSEELSDTTDTYIGYDGEEQTFAYATEFDIENTDTIYSIVLEGANATYYILTFKSECDDDDETYRVNFDYAYGYEDAETTNFEGTKGSNTTKFVVNDIYDTYLYEYAVNSTSFFEEMIEFLNGDVDSYSQDVIDDLTDAMESAVSSKDSLIDYQCGYIVNGKDIDYLVEYYAFMAQKYIDRWDAYIEIIETYEFEYSYIDNANQEDLSATYLAVQQLLGYSFENNDLIADSTISKSLTEILFASSVYALETPELFFADAIAAYADIVDILETVQAETDAVKQDIINYVVSTGYYTSDINASEARPEYVAALDFAADYFVESEGTELSYVGYTYIEGVGYAFVPVSYSTTTKVYTNAELVQTTYTLLDITITAAQNLEEIEAWVDCQVLAQMLYEDSDFWGDYEKKGIDEAMNEMFEGIIEDSQERIDVMDEDITEYGSLSYTVAN